MGSKQVKATTNLVITAMMMGLIMLMTFIIRIPVPATQGYVHLGDCMIFMGVIILGWKLGAIAAAFGSALADILGGYAFYAPVTFVVKGLMALIAALFIGWAQKKWPNHKLGFALLGMIIGGFVMVAGYYGAEVIMYGNVISPLASVPMNVVQFCVGILIAITLASAISKTPLGKNFAYSLSEDKREK